MKKLTAGTFVFLLLVACGKRGDPRPPVPVIPKATSDLVVTQRGSKVILTWSYPSLTTAGQSLHDIRRIVVYRAVEDLPVPVAGRDPKTMQPGDIDPTVPRPIALFAKIPTLTSKQFAKLRDRVDSMESANLPAATAGAKLMYEDSPALQTTDGRPVRLTYSVVTESTTARGDISNLATIVPLIVPSAPGSLAATAKAEGVQLTWVEPTSTAAEKPPLAGYNVYRYPAGQEPAALGAPVNASLVNATTYTDVPPYGDFTYVVRAVAAAGPPQIESEPSAPAKVTFKDLVPPPAPASINALVETHAVRLVWDPVTAPDLAGYKLYRTEGVGHLDQPGGVHETATLLIVPFVIPITSHLDLSVDLGIAYRYGISSVDKMGNESEKVWTGWIVVPKTP